MMDAPVRRTLAALTLMALALLGSIRPAAADGDPATARVQQVLASMDSGDAAGALKALGSDEDLVALSADPAQVHALLDRAYRTDGRLAADLESRQTLIGRLGALAEQVHTASPQNDRAAWALALSLVLKERAGPRTGPEVWGRAADLLEAVHERTPGGGEALSYAVTFLLEGARAEPDARHDLQTRADTVTRNALRAHPEEEALARALAASHTWASRALLEEKRSASKQALRTALDTLKPFLSDYDPAVETTTVYNDAVTLGKEAEFAFKERYYTLPERALEGAIEFELPMSTRWEAHTVPSSEERAGFTYVTQKDATGARVRQLLFRRYYWGSDYTFEEGTEASGDDVKKIARALQEMTAKRTFADGAEITKPSKQRLTKKLTGLRFEIAGTSRDEEPEPLRVFGYAAKGKRQATLVVLVYVYGGDEEVGVEMEAVLESIEEPKE